MDAITLLKQDHRNVEELFSQYERGDHDVVGNIARELKLHTAIEEKIIYPVVQEVFPDGQKETDHAKQEHDKVDEFLAELEQNPDDQDCFLDLKSEVLHHVEEEEKEMFPKLQELVDGGRLEELGNKIEEMKRSSPV
jgi:hemerythrin superfamily protein